MPTQRLLRSLVPAALALLLAPMASQAAAPAPAMRVLSSLPLGGAGGWDYLSFDAPHRHLFVSHGDRVLVIDVDRHKQVGTIADTQGVHGIAIADDLQRGFTSNGKSASVTEFDLGSFKTVATIGGTGENPDAIVYDKPSHHVLTFNGKSHSASVIDPAKAAVVATSAKDAAKALPAGGFIKEFTAKFGGRGGGKPEFAQGGGGDFGQFKAAAGQGLELLKAFASKAAK